MRLQRGVGNEVFFAQVLWVIPPEEATEDALSSTDEEASPGPVMGPAFEVRCPLLCS